MGARILAVDDDEGILRLLKRALERDGNMIDTVSDPMQILDRKKVTDHYDLILLDVMMPGIDDSLCLNRCGMKLTARSSSDGKDC